MIGGIRSGSGRRRSGRGLLRRRWRKRGRAVPSPECLVASRGVECDHGAEARLLVKGLYAALKRRSSTVVQVFLVRFPTAPEGAVDFLPLTASLKRCPDTNPDPTPDRQS